MNLFHGLPKLPTKGMTDVEIKGDAFHSQQTETNTAVIADSPPVNSTLKSRPCPHIWYLKFRLSKILRGDWTADAVHKELDIPVIKIDFCPPILKSEFLKMHWSTTPSPNQSDNYQECLRSLYSIKMPCIRQCVAENLLHFSSSFCPVQLCI